MSNFKRMEELHDELERMRYNAAVDEEVGFVENPILLFRIQEKEAELQKLFDEEECSVPDSPDELAMLMGYGVILEDNQKPAPYGMGNYDEYGGL